MPVKKKLALSQKLGLTIEQVQTVFKFPEIVSAFEELSLKANDTKLAFTVVFNILLGVCRGNSINFEDKFDALTEDGTLFELIQSEKSVKDIRTELLQQINN